MNKKGIAAGGLLALLITGLMPVLVGVLIIALLTGGGFALPFLDIPWYIWAGLLFIFILFLTRRK